MTEIKPCRMCGSSDVRVDLVPGPARGGHSTMHERRVCLNPDCKSNSSAPRRLGEGV